METLHKWRERFINSVVVLLLVTAAGKLVTLAQNEHFLSVQDPVFHFARMKHSLLAATILELSIAALAVSSNTRKYMIGAVAWLCVALIAYRSLANVSHPHKPCPCFGSLLDWTHLPPTSVEATALILLCYMSLGSLMFLLGPFFCRTASRPPVAPLNNLPSHSNITQT